MPPLMLCAHHFKRGRTHVDEACVGETAQLIVSHEKKINPICTTLLLVLDVLKNTKFIFGIAHFAVAEELALQMTDD